MPQDPAALQRQIETTRAELASTIDAIADKVSPKRAADRTKVQLQDKAAEIKGRIQASRGGGAPAGVLDAGSSNGVVDHGGPEVVKSIRWERVAAVGGAVLVVLIRLRSRRRKRALRARD